jgi:hypothetical protein
MLLLAASSASAQQQERKLIDRLLKPDTTLASPDQNKRFALAGSTTTKTARTRPFFIAGRARVKRYRDTRNVPVKSFATTATRDAQRAADVAAREPSRASAARYRTSDYNYTHAAIDADKTIDTSTYSETRPFLIQGKSQKALSAQDKPLTIDEVRELLNKNE